MSDKVKRWTSQGGGIYLENKTGRFYHRPTINGKATWRVIKVGTLTAARAIKSALDVDQVRFQNGVGKDPYGSATITVGELIEDYRKAGCPMKDFQAREGYQLKRTLGRLVFLETFWKNRRADEVKPKDCAKYLEARKLTCKEGTTGERSVDLELIVLSGVFHYAVYMEKILANPLTNRPRFRDHKKVIHCRDAMPLNAAEFHGLAHALFEDSRSEALGWQLLLEGMTGCRTSEVLRLRWDAKPRGAGFIDGKHLWLSRSKGGVNPWIEIHPELAETLKAMRQWRVWRGLTDSPWFIPGTDPKQAMNPTSLAHALARLGPLIAGARRTSHGLRAYYVTVRRSMGIADVQIAGEIGDSSGASIIVSTYGAIPPNWQGGEGITWTVPEPSWSVLAMPKNMLELKTIG